MNQLIVAFFFTICCFSLLFTPASALGQTQFWQENFEGNGPNMGGGDRVVPNHTDTDNGTDPSNSGCGSSDYFYRTDCNTSGSLDCSGVSDVFSGLEGSFMWRGEDLDGCIADPDIINWTGIDISGRSNIEFRGMFACDDDANEWEGASAADGHPDYLEVLYQIDGGGYNRGIIFKSDGSDHNNSGDDRGRFRIDANDDGFGESGNIMGKTFQEYSFDIAGTGTSLDLRFVAFVNGGGEEFGIDNFRLVTNPLPVELSFFRGYQREEMVELRWETVSESHNRGFEIQRSKDGKNWIKLAFIDGVGDTYELQKYTYLDRDPLAGTQFYRLKQVDISGQFELSNVISINMGEAYNTLTFFPNPNHNGLLYFSGSRTNTKLLNIGIYDSLGRLVFQKELQAMAVKEENSISIHDLPIGVYWIRAYDGHQQLIQKLVKE